MGFFRNSYFTQAGQSPADPNMPFPLNTSCCRNKKASRYCFFLDTRGNSSPPKSVYATVRRCLVCIVKKVEGTPLEHLLSKSLLQAVIIKNTLELCIINLELLVVELDSHLYSHDKITNWRSLKRKSTNEWKLQETEAGRVGDKMYRPQTSFCQLFPAVSVAVCFPTMLFCLRHVAQAMRRDTQKHHRLLQG